MSLLECDSCGWTLDETLIPSGIERKGGALSKEREQRFYILAAPGQPDGFDPERDTFNIYDRTIPNEENTVGHECVEAGLSEQEAFIRAAGLNLDWLLNAKLIEAKELLIQSLEALEHSLDAKRPGATAPKETCEELEALCSRVEQFLGFHWD